MLFLSFFFFQAEDGIRDDLVTGVQTCALPISWRVLQPPARLGQPRRGAPRPLPGGGGPDRGGGAEAAPAPGLSRRSDERPQGQGVPPEPVGGDLGPPALRELQRPAG